MDLHVMINLHRGKSHRFLDDADAMVQQQHWDLAANRYYHACFHIVHAPFLKDGLTVKTHDGTLTTLGKTYILTGRIEKKHGYFFARMIQLRIKADYNSVAEVSESEVREMASLSHEFVDRIESILDPQTL